MDQAHQYGLKVLPLGRVKNVSKGSQVVAQGAFLDDNGMGYGFPRGLSVRTPNLPGEAWLLVMGLLKVQND
jgi:hypothetical protein